MSDPQRIITDFTAGELGGKFGGRVDLAIYGRGAAILENWIPFSQGGVRTRPGSKYLGLTLGDALGRLHSWVVSTGVGYVLEFTALKLRFWQVSDGALFGAPLELTTPYTTAAHCRQLHIAQDGNKLFIAHADYAVQIVSWSGSNFSIAAAVFAWNVGDATFASTSNYPTCVAAFNQRIWFAATKNAMQTVWASRAFVYAEARGVAWQVSYAYETGDIVINDSGKLYTCITAGTSAGAGGPTGTSADITDGTVHWSYWCASGTIDMTYYERRRYVVDQVEDPSTWTDPDTPEIETVTIYRDIQTDDAAMKLPLYSDKSDRIQTLVAGQVLVIGTQFSEYVITPDIVATAPKAPRQSGNGCEYRKGILLEDSLLFLQRHATRLRKWVGGEASQTPDLTFQNDGVLGTSGAEELDAATVPEPTVLLVRNDGQIAGLLLNELVGTQAWYRITAALSGLYKSIAVVPGTGVDQVWAIVLRSTHYCVERFDGLWDATAIPLDAWVDVPAAGATVTGLERFASKTATIWNVTDSTTTTAAVSAGGSMTVPAASIGDHIVVGGGYSCVGQTMRLGGLDIQMIAGVVARVYASYPFKLGRANTAAALEEWTVPVGFTAPYTGDVDCPFLGDWDRATCVYFVQDEPYHAALQVLAPKAAT